MPALVSSVPMPSCNFRRVFGEPSRLIVKTVSSHSRAGYAAVFTLHISSFPSDAAVVFSLLCCPGFRAFLILFWMLFYYTTLLLYSIRTKNCARNRNCATFQLTVPRSPVLILNFAGHKYLPLHVLYEFKRKIGLFFNIRNRLNIIGKSNYYFLIFRFFGYKIQRNVFTEMLLSNKS
jgi:hypothetical protein